MLSLIVRTAYSYNPDSQLYGQSSGGTYFDSQAGGTHVTTVVSSASSGVPPHGMVGIAMDVGSSHIISSGSTYLLHSGGMEGNRNHISHSSRSSSAMLQWLLDNYEMAEGVSLPRCSLYNHYLRHCQEQKLDPVNAASFGKLIRSVFMGLRTRRLGTRFKPLQKVDSMSDSLCGSSQHCSSTPEQSVAAQSQQHQQYIAVFSSLRSFQDMPINLSACWVDISVSLWRPPIRPLCCRVAVVSAFAQTLRRYTSLNHLAQAARAVLQNTSQINQMLSDLNRVDFANVQVTLQQQSSLDQWATWLDNVVSQVLKPHQGSPSFPKAARQFLLKWSFYSSMVIRDLTLRSAASFGSFHLIRLLYDEYMFYLVEHRVAQATGETPIAVMGEV
ncbi:hypothetical protein GOODEAATRI_001836 [Goodea atripinnis]|uniref:DNA-binding protein RFX2 n=1 Tax=Goodea atripinnis TaxID=208336 RepID=A0ABV0NGQ7_9TELE